MTTYNQIKDKIITECNTWSVEHMYKELEDLLSSQRQEIIKDIKGMKKEHYKGCKETILSSDYAVCRCGIASYDQAISDIILKLKKK